jgi:hypothetical protein
LLFYFCELIPRVILLVFVLVSAASGDKKYLNFKWLWYCAVAGQGTRAGLSHLSSGVVSVAQFNPWQAHVIVVDAYAPPIRGATHLFVGRWTART